MFIHSTDKYPGSPKGFTLIELTVVIIVMIGLTAVGFLGANAYTDWTKGREASETLREVFAAQKMYLADHPTDTPADITANDLLPYMSDQAAFPTITALDGSSKTITVTVMPPTIQGDYDPSGSTTDNLWDVGE